MAFEQPAIAILALDPAVRAMLAEDLPEQAEGINAALAHNDPATAISIVHSVHGTAGFCRLGALRESAARLEAVLKNNEKKTEALIAFQNDVKHVLHALEHEHS